MDETPQNFVWNRPPAFQRWLVGVWLRAAALWTRGRPALAQAAHTEDLVWTRPSWRPRWRDAVRRRRRRAVLDPRALRPESPTEEAIEPTGRWALLVRVGLAVALVAGLLVGASFLVRSEWFLRSRIDPKLEQLGQKMQGTFTYERVSPIGLTGVVVEGVTFQPDARLELASPLHIDRLVVYPDLGAMLTGDLKPHALEVEGVQAVFWLDGGPTGRGHWPWLETVVDAWTQRVPESGARQPGRQVDPSFPSVHLTNARISLQSPQGVMPHIGMRVDDMDVRMVGDQLELDGAIHVDGLGYAMLSGDANRVARRAGVVVKLVDTPDILDLAPDSSVIRNVVGENSRLELGGVAVQWPPALILSDVRLTDTHIGVPGHDAAFVEELGAREIALELEDHRAKVRVSDFDASVRVEWFETLSARLPIRLPLLDLLVDLESRRVGAGFRVDSQDHGQLALSAALDVDTLDLAVRLEARRFDAGSLLSFMPYTGPVEVRSAVLDGQALLRFPLHEELLVLDASLVVSDLDFRSSWLAEDWVEDANVSLDVRSTVDLLARKLTVDEGKIGIGELFFDVLGSVRQTGEGRNIAIEAHVDGENLPASEVLTSLPRALAPALEGYALEGTFGVRCDLAVDTGHPDEMIFDPRLDVSDLRVTRHGPRADIPVLATDDFAVRIAAADGEHLVGPSTRGWVGYNVVPSYFVHGLIATEDASFFGHNGFDTRAIRSSLVANIEAGKVVRGGSTISQQVVKNLFLSPRKTLARKLQEAFLTWELEQRVDKRRIIELYMNLAQWGEGVYGIREAARYYFDKHPTRLSVRESLFLAAILPNPVFFGRQYAEGFIRSDRLAKMRNGLVVLLRQGILGKQAYDYNLSRLKVASISSSPRPALAPSPQEAPAVQNAPTPPPTQMWGVQVPWGRVGSGAALP